MGNIARYICPLAAIGIAAVGAIRGIRVMAGGVYRNEWRDRLDMTGLRPGDCYRLWYELVICRHVDDRNEYEFYYGEKTVTVPRSAYDVYRFGDASRMSAENRSGRLKGFSLHVTDVVPNHRYFEGGYSKVKPEYGFGAFCRNYGVRRSTVDLAMSEVRGRFYGSLVRMGKLSGDRLV